MERLYRRRQPYVPRQRVSDYEVPAQRELPLKLPLGRLPNFRALRDELREAARRNGFDPDDERFAWIDDFCGNSGLRQEAQYTAVYCTGDNPLPITGHRVVKIEPLADEIDRLTRHQFRFVRDFCGND